MVLALVSLLFVPVCVRVSPPIHSLTPRPVAKTAMAERESLFVCLSLHHLSLDDLFACVAAFGSGFVQFSQRKPCHNSEFLTGQQLPGQAAADQRRINTCDKLSTGRWYVSSLGTVSRASLP